MPDLVLTLIGPDRPGIVEAIAEPIARHGGNWLESRMAHLAGKFAGILRIEVPAEQASLLSALSALEASGLKLTIEAGPEAAGRAGVADVPARAGGAGPAGNRPRDLRTRWRSAASTSRS